MNRVFLIGNLTKDPEVSTTSNDIAVCKFSIGVTRRASAGKDKESDFFNIVAWRGQAENCGKYLRKGSKVGICGSIQNETYETSDGTKKYITKIIADEVQFLSTKNDSGDFDELPPAPTAHSTGAAKSAGKGLKPIEDDGDLPF